MFKFTFSEELTKEQEIQKVLQELEELCQEDDVLQSLEICDYRYTLDEAVEELCIDEEMIDIMLHEYIKQIFEALFVFDIMVRRLELDASLGKELDFSMLSDLAHKNLGVARNLRVKDGQKLLYEIMHTEDIEYIEHCLELLEYVTIKLDPDKAYDFVQEVVEKGFDPEAQKYLLAEI